MPCPVPELQLLCSACFGREMEMYLSYQRLRECGNIVSLVYLC